MKKTQWSALDEADWLYMKLDESLINVKKYQRKLDSVLKKLTDEEKEKFNKQHVELKYKLVRGE